jgi:hypothetical protein
MLNALRKTKVNTIVPAVSAKRGALALAGFLTAAAPNIEALEFNLRQIADDAMINRDAVIGEGGQVSWMQYDTNTLAQSISDIVVWRGGERRNLTQESASEFFGNAKPVVESNAIVWIANYRVITEPHSWVLREVPTRDEGAEEIPALYRVEVRGEEQVFINVADTGRVFVVTNELGEVTTNVLAVPPEQQIRRLPSGVTEINFWPGTGEIVRVTRDYRHDFNPSFSGRLIAYQKEKGFPFGWEIMVWDDGINRQLTTNFYYDMAPKVHGRQVVWYGWDGYDFEIYLYDADRNATVQITSNRYDDVSPVIWNGHLAWEGYPAVESDIYFYRDGQILKISESIEDDINPRIWNGQVVWQSFDGDDFEIYLYDGAKSLKVTANDFDDTNPDIRDGIIVWMGYEGNWDAEIYAWDGRGQPVRLTDNDEEDRDPRTAGGRIVWTVDRQGRSQVWLAEPR